MNSTAYALAFVMCTVLVGSGAADPQSDQTRLRKCSAVQMDWNKANKSGQPGRRKALKSVLESAKADPVIAECFSEKIKTDLMLATLESSAQQGWLSVIKTNTNNFTAAKDQAKADQCPASKLIIAGWNAFYAQRRDAGDLLDKSAQGKHKALCGG